MGFFTDETTYSLASEKKNLNYVVIQVTLKQKRLVGTGSRNLEALEKTINKQVSKGYRLHSIATTGTDSLLGGQKIQATLVFEKID